MLTWQPTFFGLCDNLETALELKDYLSSLDHHDLHSDRFYIEEMRVITSTEVRNYRTAETQSTG